MYEVCYDYVKTKYGENVKLCYMDTSSFIVYIKTDNLYKDIANDVETRFDTTNYELDRLLSKGKNKKVTGLMKDELSEKIMTRFSALRETYSCLTDDGAEDKKGKGIKKVCHKKKN